MAILSTMVGAVLLSRAVNDERLSKPFLQAAAERVPMGSSAGPSRTAPMTEAPPRRHRRAHGGLPRELSAPTMIIEDREASLAAKYASAEPRYWANAA